MSKDKKKSQKRTEEDMLAFIRDIEKKASTTKGPEVVKELIKNIPNSDNDNLKIHYTNLFYDTLEKLKTEEIKSLVEGLSSKDTAQFYQYVNKCFYMMIKSKK